MPPFKALLALGLTLALAGPASAVVVEESDTLEFSGVHTSPTDLGIFLPGTNLVTGAVQAIGRAEDFIGVPEMAGTADIFTFEIGEGTQLNEIILNSYSSDQPAPNNMFIALHDDSTFFFSALELNDEFVIPDLSNILAGTVIGDGPPSQVGTDVLDNLQAAGQIAAVPPLGRDFDIPLGPGNYTVYLQETTGTSNYQLAFNVSAVPEPSSTFAMAAACVGIVAYRRVRRRKQKS